MKDNTDVARGWFAKGESDLAAAQVLLDSEGPFDILCFHCQPTAEKYLKGFLAFHDTEFPFRHALDRLTPLCTAIDATLLVETDEVHALTDYAVKLRYDNAFWPTREEAPAAVEVIVRLRDQIRSRLPADMFQSRKD